MSFKPTTLALAMALALSACGGDGSDSNTGSDTGGTGGTGGGGGGTGGTSTTVSGKAADGYLIGAAVCLDLDSNMNCDANEPTATTGAGGAFTLTIPEGVDAASYPIVVQVSTATIDEDTSTAVGKPYVLSAPAGESDFISPLTTVVHGMLQQNPALTLDDAIAQVKLSIGASADVNLFEDYVAAKQDTNNTAQDEYERLHRVAQVAAKTMAENHEAIMEAAATQGIDTTESNAALLALVINQVIDELEGAAQAVDEAGDAFSVDAVTVQTADVTNLAEQIQEAEDVASATQVSIESLLAQGMYWVESAEDEHEYGYVKSSAVAGRIEESWSFFDTTTSTWVTGDEEDASHYLTAGGWTPASDAAPNYAVTYQTDGSALLQLDNTDYALKLSAAEVDVSGKPIKDYLGYETHQAVASTIVGDPTFSSGAKIYSVYFIVQADSYVMSNWYDCEQQPTDPSGSCNVVFGHASNTVFAPAQSFADLFYPTGTTPAGNWFEVGNGIELRLTTDGVIHITDTQAPEGQQASSGEWQYTTVHGEQIMLLNLPALLKERQWEDGQPILAVRDGYVRRGKFLRAGTPEAFGEINFSETAFEDIQNNSSVY